MRHASSAPGSKRLLRRAALWIGIFSLLLSLITPIIQLHEASAAQGDPPDCDAGYIDDESLNQCVEDPNAQDGQEDLQQPQCDEGQVYSEDQVGCIADPALQPECEDGQVYDGSYGGCVPDPNQEAEPVGVQVEKYDCSGLDFDPYAASFNDLQSACGANGTSVSMTVGSDNGDQTKPTTNYTEWTDLPAGSGYISEGVPDGYSEPLVWCGVYVPNESQPSPSQYGVQNGSAIGWDLEPGEYLYCWWFNIGEDGGTGVINITKYDCSAYTEDPLSASFGDLSGACTSAMSGVPFELYAGQQLVGGPQTPASGQYSFPDVPVGEVTVAESLADGYDYGLVFCSYHPADQANGNTPDPVSLTDGTYFSWTMEADYVLECVWFNFGEGDGGTNWIDFYKYECAWNTPTDGNADYYQQECALVDDWDFDAQWDGGGSTKTTDGSGLASWEGVPTGSWTGSESVPDGYGQPIVYCRYVEWPDEAGYDNNWFPNDPSGGELSYQFEYDNVRIECYWFNFLPEDGGNQVDLYKYDCAFDAPHDEGKGYYEQECQPRASWDLDLQWDGGGETKATGDDGGASWTGLPQGEWTGSETIAEGYGEPLVWCRYVEWPDEASYNQDWESFPVQGAAFTHDFEYDAGVRIECHIYNFPPDGEGSWIEFYKYVCDEDTAYDTDPGTLASECALAPEYTFSVQSGDYNEEKPLTAVASPPGKACPPAPGPPPKPSPRDTAIPSSTAATPTGPMRQPASTTARSSSMPPAANGPATSAGTAPASSAASSTSPARATGSTSTSTPAQLARPTMAASSTTSRSARPTPTARDSTSPGPTAVPTARPMAKAT